MYSLEINEEYARVRADERLTGLQQANLKSLAPSAGGLSIIANAGSSRADFISARQTLNKRDTKARSVMGSSPTAVSFIDQAALVDSASASTKRTHTAEELVEAPRVRPTTLTAYHKSALLACRLVTQVIDHEETQRSQLFRSAFDTLQHAVIGNDRHIAMPGVFDPEAKHSELDFPAAIRLLPVADRAEEWEKVADLFIALDISEATREGRQQIGALIVASAYIPLAQIQRPLQKLFDRIDLRPNAHHNATALGEVHKRIILLSDLDERVSVFFKLSERFLSAPPLLRTQLAARLSQVIPFLPPDVQKIALGRMRDTITQSYELVLDEIDVVHDPDFHTIL